MKQLLIISLWGSLLLLSAACDQKSNTNPFDDIEKEKPSDQPELNLDPQSIAGLHANIFKPTCANSGCHDGTFEPDFRTIESSYNSLVYHPIIKNDPQGSFEYRVLPSDADASVLMARLNYDIDNNSGIMPLATEPDSDWETQRETYLEDLRAWIQAGAKDVFGNAPTGPGNAPPRMDGVVGKTGNGNWLGREDAGQGAFRIPQSQSTADFYFAFKDDETAATNLSYNKIKFSTSINDFENANELNLELLNTPILAAGYYTNDDINYYHKITLNPLDYASLGETVFFRVYVKDENNPTTEIPSDDGTYYIKTYFSFTIIE